MFQFLLSSVFVFFATTSWAVDPTTFLRISDWKGLSAIEHLDRGLLRRFATDRFGNQFEIVFGNEDLVKNAILANWRIEVTGQPNLMHYPTFVEVAAGHFVPGYVRPQVSSIQPQKLATPSPNEHKNSLESLMKIYGIESEIHEKHGYSYIADFTHAAPQGSIRDFMRTHQLLAMAGDSYVQFPHLIFEGPLSKKPVIETLWSLFWASESERKKLLAGSQKQASLLRFSRLLSKSTDQTENEGLLESYLKRAQNDWSGLYEILPQLKGVSDGFLRSLPQLHLNPLNPNTLVVVAINDPESEAIARITQQAGAKWIFLTDESERTQYLTQNVVDKILNFVRLKHITRVVLSEMPERAPGLEDQIRKSVHDLVIVDHHKYPEVDRFYPLSSLEQMSQILGYKMSDELKVIAVRDRSGPIGLLDLGLSKNDLLKDSLNRHQLGHVRRSIVQEIPTSLGKVVVLKGDQSKLGTTSAYIATRIYPDRGSFISFNKESIQVAGNPTLVTNVKAITEKFPGTRFIEGGDPVRSSFIIMRGTQSISREYFDQLRSYLNSIAERGHRFENLLPPKTPGADDIITETDPDVRFDKILRLSSAVLSDYDRERLVSYFKSTSSNTDLIALILMAQYREKAATLLIPLESLLISKRDLFENEIDPKILKQVFDRIRRLKDETNPPVKLEMMTAVDRVAFLKSLTWITLDESLKRYLLDYQPTNFSFGEFKELMRVVTNSSDPRWIAPLERWERFLSTFEKENQRKYAKDLLSQAQKSVHLSQTMMCPKILK